MKNLLPIVMTVMVLTAVSCGKGTAPLSIVDSTTGNGMPSLSLPIDMTLVTTITPTSAGAVNTSVVGFRFNGATGLKTSALAPCEGVVTSVVKENTNPADPFHGLFTVTITQSATYETRIRMLDSATVNPGDYVRGGQIIGTTNGTGGRLLQMDQRVEGREACPYTFLNMPAKILIAPKITGRTPCPTI